MWNRYCMVPSHVHMVPLHLKCLHVSYASYGLPYLIWNMYCMVPHMYVWSPLTLYGRAIIWSLNMYVCSPHMWSRYFMVSHQLILNRYCMVPHMYIWSPNMCCVFMSYISLMVPHTLYGIGIVWSSYMYTWSPTCTIWCQWLLCSPIPYME